MPESDPLPAPIVTADDAYADVLSYLDEEIEKASGIVLKTLAKACGRLESLEAVIEGIYMLKEEIERRRRAAEGTRDNAHNKR